MLSKWSSRIGRFARTGLFVKLTWCVGALALYTALINFVEKYVLGWDLEFGLMLHGMVGAVLSLLVVFRTNGAYDRWWEGRKLWGSLVNDSRNLILDVSLLPGVPGEERQRMQRYVAWFGRALRDHLRGKQAADARAWMTVPEQVEHVPVYLCGRMKALLQEWRAQERVDGYSMLVLERPVRSLVEQCGGCERIRATPLPLSHRALIPQLLLVYLVVMPWGLSYEAWTVPLMAGIGYFLIGLELIAEELEDPFGMDADDLPLDRLCTEIEETTAEILATQVPLEADRS